MERKVRHWLRSGQGLRTLVALFVVLVLGAALGQVAGWWDMGALLGTAGPRQEEDEAQRRPLARVSVSRTGIEGNKDSFAPVISTNGRYVAFLSTADNLVADDNNEEQDVFLYHREADQIRRVTVGVAGAEANGRSRHLAFSQDGQVVVFASVADNLVAGDDNDVEDIFIYDTGTDTLARASVGAEGAGGNGMSVQPAVSPEGRYVTFVSLADNLVAADGNGVADIFVHDRETGETQRVSRADSGEEADATSKYPAITAGGRYIAFQSKAENLVPGAEIGVYDIFVYDRESGEIELITRGVTGDPADGESQRPTLSDDGRYVAFESWATNLVEGDANGHSDVFVYDRQAGKMELVSVGPDGEQANGVNGSAVISADGQYVVFASLADNLAEEDQNSAYDVYVHHRRTGQTRLVSTNLEGRAGNGSSISPSLALEGSFIVFDSVATDLVGNDENGRVDVFIFDALLAGDGETPVQLYLPLVTQD